MPRDFRVFGEVSERFKEHAWKVCVRQKRTEGSNPSLSASQIEMGPMAPFLFDLCIGEFEPSV